MITLRTLVYDIFNTLNRGEAEEVNISKRHVAFKIDLLRKALIQDKLDKQDFITDDFYKIVNLNVDSNSLNSCCDENILQVGKAVIPPHLKGKQNKGVEWIRTSSKVRYTVSYNQMFLDKIEVNHFSLYKKVHAFIELNDVYIYPYIATISIKLIPEFKDIDSNMDMWMSHTL